MDFEIDIDKKILNQVKENLKSAVDDSVRQSDIDYAGSQILSIIMLRNQRGKYLTKKTGGSSQSRKYKSDSWKKKRREKGLQTNRVSLFFGEGGLLEGMRVRGRSVRGNVEIDAGYIAGISEAKARQIATYMNDTGVGINRVLYRYIGLTRGEQKQIVSALRNRIRKNLKDQTS